MTKTKAQPAPAALLAAPTLPTEREVDGAYGVCGYCGKTPAVFNSIRSEFLCSACTKTNTLSDACYEHLKELVAPAVSTWGHHWDAVGLSKDELTAHLGDFTGSGQVGGAARFLTSTLEAYPVQEYVPAQPDRVLLDAATLPTIATVSYYSDTYPGTGQPFRCLHFTAHNADGSACKGLGQLMGGRDVLLILNAIEGDALLYYTGIHGQTEPNGGGLLNPAAYRVPAAFVAQIQDELGGWKAKIGD